MKRIIGSFVLLVTLCGFAMAQFADPFKVSVSLDGAADNVQILSLSFMVPAEHHIYKDMITVKATDGISLKPDNIPVGKQEYDALTEKNIAVYDADTVQRYILNGVVTDSSTVTVGYQGCSGSLCFAPESRTFNIMSGKEVVAVESEGAVTDVVAESGDWRVTADKFEIVNSASGYLGVSDFIAFLNGSGSSGFGERGIWLTILLILLGGMALNLTPCVLPMIPINIAIIGAGVQSGSRTRGFLLGSVYGAGIAFVYGVLGLAVILTGAKFGSLNSLPIFNFGIALLFAGLSLSMFGLFNIDLTKFQGKMGNEPKKRGGLLPTFLMGGVAALLAGACVAPVVISVLLLATNLYQAGNVVALLLPFVLGLGMALPWPFAGAGLSFLPKPGQWMERIKQLFGVIIMVAALYYAFVGFRIIKSRTQKDN